ncbi:hypothetical protein BS640_18680 [Rouxiella badensis]|uniref:Uncharacterized protein n=2 Tax=Rouxiella badensis TaxID=1646377 RepID=A0A1X0WB83_9GAMM|nr:hypothetical protein BS640_18680 [Rouxiella badensis]
MKLFNAGFTTKQQQKDTLTYINRAYEAYRSCITDLLWEIPHEEQTEAQSRIYWSIPRAAYLLKLKHVDAILAIFPAASPYLEEMLKLAELRRVVKIQEVVKPDKEGAEMQAKAAHVHVTILERMQRLGRQYEKALTLPDLFGGLNVHANVHVVTNQHGTRYLRAFYYLDGKLTPLPLIIAAHEAHARKKKDK